jgi:hypothetical protein
MALKAILDKLEDAPEALREHYQPSEDGKFVLAVTDDHPLRRKAQALLDEKKATKAQLEELAKRYEGLDPDEHKRLRAELEEVRSGKGETVGKILAAERAKLQEEYGSKYGKAVKERDELKGEAEEYRKKYSDKLLSDGLRDLIVREKIKLSGDGAFNDLVRRAGEHFVADPKTGKISAKATDSLEESKGAAEWLRERTRDPLDAHLFDRGEGGGSLGGKRGPGGKVYLTSSQIAKPTPEQFKIIESGNYIEVDG